MIRKEKVQYYLFNETLASEEDTRKYHKILHENVIEKNGARIMTLTFKQVLQSAGVRNWNGRIYGNSDGALLMNAITKNPLIQYDLKMNTWGGEYGHPIIEKGQNELARQMTLFPPNVCWIVAKPHMEGNLLVGECTTVAGGYGDVLRDRILSGVPPMASSRAVGGCDSNGNVLAGYTLCYIDSVWRPSHKEAYGDMNSIKVNNFDVPVGNSMTESAVLLDPKGSAVRDFLMSESVSREKISRVCDTLHMDYDTMVITENAVKITRIDGDSKTTVVMPMNRVIDTEYYNLFK